MSRSSLMSGNTTAVAIWKKCDKPWARATRLMVRTSVLSACSNDFLYETCDGVQDLFRLILVRRMAAVGQFQQLAESARLRFDGIQLRHAAVFVRFPLDRQHRAFNARQVLLDV